MLARYDGECATCDGAIFAGRDEITRDARGNWVHANADDCEPRQVYADDFIGKPVDVCPICHCMRPCWCPEAIQAPEDAADRALRRAKETAARDPWDGF